MRRASENITYERILVVRFSSLGDIVLTTPALDGLRAKFPDSRIFYLVKEEFAPILQNHTSGCEIIDMPADAREDSRRFVEFVEALAKGKFDLVVDLQGNARSFVLRRKIDADYVKVKKHTLRRMAIVRWKLGARGLPNIRDRFFRALRPLGITPETRGHPSLDLTEQEIRAAVKKFFGGKVKKPLAIIHPGAKWPLKEWGEDKFARLINLLIENDFNVASFGEASYNNTIPLHDTTIRELMACIALGDIFIGNDSGPLHIAEALGVPSLGIFGPTHEMLGYASDGEGAEIIGLDLKCRPCSLYGGGRCKTGNRECMENLSPEAVFERAQEVYRRGLERVGKTDGE